MMQLVRIWRLEEIKERCEDYLKANKNMYERSGYEKKALYLTGLFTSTDRTSC
jgi:hypothetical protein